MDDTIRLVFVDDHGLDRQQLAELVEAHVGMQILARVGKPDDARANDPDLAVVDLRQDKDDGLGLVCRMRSAGHPAPVVVLAVGEPADDRMPALRIDGRGYRLDGVAGDGAFALMPQPARNDILLAPDLTCEYAEVRPDELRRERDSPLRRLTDRERQVLEHLILGGSNKAIARALGISHDTVKLHVRHILAKLHVATRLEAAVLAVEVKMDRAGSHATRAAPRLAFDAMAQRA